MLYVVSVIDEHHCNGSTIFCSNVTQSNQMLSITGHTSAPQRLHASAFLQPTTKTLSEIKEDLARPLYRKDIFFSGSIYNIAEFKSRDKVAEDGTVAKHVVSLVSIPPSEVSVVMYKLL